MEAKMAKKAQSRVILEFLDKVQKLHKEFMEEHKHETPGFLYELFDDFMIIFIESTRQFIRGKLKNA